MEEKWNEKREEHKQQVAELTRITDCTEQDLKELQQYFHQASREMRSELARLTQDREIISQELEKWWLNIKWVKKKSFNIYVFLGYRLKMKIWLENTRYTRNSYRASLLIYLTLLK